MNFPDLFLSEETARVLAFGGYAVMFFCMGLAPLLLRSERRNRRISCNSPSNLSESDHPKAATIVSVMLPGRVRDRDRLAFGHAHSQINLASNARMMAVEEGRSVERFAAEESSPSGRVAASNSDIGHAKRHVL